MATEQHIFSTGVLLVGAAGNAQLFQQTLNLNGATGGTFSLTYSGQTALGISNTVTATTLQSILAGLSSIGTGNVTVTSPAAGIYVITLAMQLGAINIITLNGSGLTGGTGAAVTNTLATSKLAAVQDITIDVAYTDKVLMTSAQESVFGIDVGFHEGKATMKSTVKDFNQLAYTTLYNMTKTTSGTPPNAWATYEITANTTPQFFRAEFYMQDTNGKQGIAIATRAYSKSLSQAFKLTDFADRVLDIDTLADPNATGAIGYGIPLTLMLQQ